jgi:hypothetical protein
MTTKLILLTFLASCIHPALASAKADVAQLQKELMAQIKRVDEVEAPVKEFNRLHPDPKKWTQAEQRRSAELEQDLNQAQFDLVGLEKELNLALDSSERRPAAGQAYEHPNGGCAYAADNLAFAKGARWRADGKLSFDKEGRKAVVSETFEANAQTLVVKGHGVLFAPAKGDNERTTVRLEFTDEGKLARLSLEENIWKRHKQHVDYTWSDDRCSVKQVTVEAPELAGKTGVSYDRELCRAMAGKGLLGGKIDQCIEFNDRVSAEIEKAAKDYGDKKAFALFTTDATGRTTLKEWKKKDHLSVNAAIARDCAYQEQYSGRPPAQGSGFGDDEQNPNAKSAR